MRELLILAGFMVVPVGLLVYLLLAVIVGRCLKASAKRMQREAVDAALPPRR